jgi:hypothetical protein
MNSCFSVLHFIEFMFLMLWCCYSFAFLDMLYHGFTLLDLCIHMKLERG